MGLLRIWAIGKRDLLMADKGSQESSRSDDSNRFLGKNI